MSRIVDTSVVVKWSVRENGWEAAAALIGEDLVAPDLLRAELANALWKKVRRQEITGPQALAGQRETEALLTFLPAIQLTQRALRIGLELAHPVYDGFFIALAEATGFELITADRRLIVSCRGSRFEPLLEPL